MTAGFCRTIPSPSVAANLNDEGALGTRGTDPDATPLLAMTATTTTSVGNMPTASGNQYIRTWNVMNRVCVNATAKHSQQQTRVRAMFYPTKSKKQHLLNDPTGWRDWPRR